MLKSLSFQWIVTELCGLITLSLSGRFQSFGCTIASARFEEVDRFTPLAQIAGSGCDIEDSEYAARERSHSGTTEAHFQEQNTPNAGGLSLPPAER